MPESTDYWSALDEKNKSTAEQIGLNPSRVGIAHGIGDIGQGLKANIFRGAKEVELGFMGTGKGFRSQPTGSTPESYGRREREEIRELARINEISLSTHASPNMGTVSGLTDRGFDPQSREKTLHEIKKAVEFAAETAEGGPVVLHLQEFPRAIFEADEKFIAHPEERERAPLYLVDKRTGELQAIRRDAPVPVPKLNKDESYVRDERGVVEFESKTFKQLEGEAIEKAQKEGREIRPGEFLREYYNKQLQLQQGEEARWGTAWKEAEENIKQIKSLKENFEKSLETAENKDYVRATIRKTLQQRGLLPEGVGERGIYLKEKHKKYLERPEEFLSDIFRDHQTQAEFYRNNSMAAGRSSQEMRDKIDNFEPIKDYAVEKSANTIARAAMSAYEEEKKKNLEKPLFIAPENWNPEMYGNHPKEYKEIIQESRKEMQRFLQEQKGMTERESKKVAADHIKGTFDIGHLNFWKKYFKGSDEEFHNWVEKEVKELTKDNIIGHVHLTDNFGYDDEHLSPGEGNAPIQRFIKQLEEKGYTGKYIVEPGGQREGLYHTAWTGALGLTGSPIYRLDARTQTWSDIESSYFGRAPQSPYFLVGESAPSKDWTLWSETPLE